MVAFILPLSLQGHAAYTSSSKKLPNQRCSKARLSGFEIVLNKVNLSYLGHLVPIITQKHIQHLIYIVVNQLPQQRVLNQDIKQLTVWNIITSNLYHQCGVWALDEVKVVTKGLNLSCSHAFTNAYVDVKVTCASPAACYLCTRHHTSPIDYHSNPCIS